MALKKVGYYISKGRCLRVYQMKKRNRSGRMINKRVNSKGKSLKKGTRVFKSKAACKKAIKKMMKRRTRKSPKRTRKSPRRTRKSPKRTRKSPRRSRFGQELNGAPYFGQMIPRIPLSKSAWRWPAPGAINLDKQQLRHYNM